MHEKHYSYISRSARMAKVYDISYRYLQNYKKYPEYEAFGIVSQIRRCAVSIPSDIAEGYGRNSTKDYLRFLRISMGSLFELQTQMEISNNLEY